MVAPDEERLWTRLRSSYEVVSRLSQLRVVGAPLRWILESITDIPRLHPYRDLSAPTRSVRTLARLVRRGLGEGLVRQLRATGAPLLTTFFSSAIAADHARCERIFCVVTDTDISRVWAPVDPARTRIQYLSARPCTALASSRCSAGRSRFSRRRRFPSTTSGSTRSSRRPTSCG